MMRVLVCLVALLLSAVCLGIKLDLNQAYQKGKDFGKTLNLNNVSPGKISLSIVPGYKGNNPKETQYRNSDLSPESGLQVKHNEIGQLVAQDISKRSSDIANDLVSNNKP